MVAVIFYSPLLFQTRVAHITAEGNITHEVHITRQRRIELSHLLYRRCAMRKPTIKQVLISLRDPNGIAVRPSGFDCVRRVILSEA